MFELQSFSLTDMLECSDAMRQLSGGADSMEEVAASVVRYLYEHFVEPSTGEPSLALVRFYKTHLYEHLEPELQEFAHTVAPDAGALEGVPCLTLLATAGQEPSWNDRRASKSHRAIPLPSTAAMAESPMIYELVTAFGVDPGLLLAGGSPSEMAADRANYNIFFVPEARDSPFVPAQDGFVVPYGIRSVLGCGGLLPNGALFAVVMFSKTAIPPDNADAFATVALSVKVAILPFVDRRVFISDPQGGRGGRSGALVENTRLLRSEVEALNQLLEVRHRTVVEQAQRLERALRSAEERAEELAAAQQALTASEARNRAVVEGALDAIITMDSTGRVLEFNPAAERTFGYERSYAVGRVLAELIIPEADRARHAGGLASYLKYGNGPVLNKRVEVTALRRDGTEFPAELTVTAVLTPGAPLFTGYVRDITARRLAETELMESRRRFAHIARTLQESLLPPSLPDVPGLAVASAYRAGGEGNEIGGDFYDVFEIARDDWGVVLGDVCGKGPEAAALTAMVRHTLRAAAIRVRKPTAVLSVVNDAVLRQNSDERFCTIVYARIRLADGRVTMTLASGGHPPPMLVTATGHVTPLHSPGRLIGLFADWKGKDRRVLLNSGDTVLFYSDGITEARASGSTAFFGDDGLHRVLVDAAGLSATAMVRRVQAAAINFAGVPGDDVAILGVQVTKPSILTGA